MGSMKFLDKGMDEESLVKADVPDLARMPEELCTEAVCLAAVQKDGMALQFVPEALRTVNVCREAVRWNHHALQFVPDRLKTPDLAISLLALVSHVCSLEEVPPDERRSRPDFQTEAGCVAAVRQKAWALQFVPVHLLTKGVVQAAIDSISDWLENMAARKRGKDAVAVLRP